MDRCKLPFTAWSSLGTLIVQLFSRVWFSMTLWTISHQAPWASPYSQSISWDNCEAKKKDLYMLLLSTCRKGRIKMQYIMDKRIQTALLGVLYWTSENFVLLENKPFKGNYSLNPFSARYFTWINPQQTVPLQTVMAHCPLVLLSSWLSVNCFQMFVFSGDSCPQKGFVEGRVPGNDRINKRRRKSSNDQGCSRGEKS